VYDIIPAAFLNVGQNELSNRINRDPNLGPNMSNTFVPSKHVAQARAARNCDKVKQREKGREEGGGGVFILERSELRDSHSIIHR
jgi:hypothetical protein